MKAKKNLLTGITLGAFIGWVLGFLRLPHLEKNFSFWVGFIACLAVISLGIVLLFVWNKNSILFKIIGKEQSPPASKSGIKSYIMLWSLAAAFIIAGFFVNGILIFRQNEFSKWQTRNQNRKISEIAEMMESVRYNNQVLVVQNVLDKANDELRNNEGRKLSDETIVKIAAILNHSFKPYRFWEGDSLSRNKLSPERGQLLSGLYAMKIDSGSFKMIKHKASFSGADLRGINLQGIDLSKADLQEADFTDADLSGANLSGANLRNANFSRAALNNANLNNADLRRANLNWAELNGAVLKSANLNGANAANAQLIKADLSNANFQWGLASGAMLNDANLTGVDFLATVMTRANLSGANLKRANLGRANLIETIMTGADIHETSVEEKDWLEKLSEWRITGAAEVQQGYIIMDDTTKRYRDSKYLLERKQ